MKTINFKLCGKCGQWQVIADGDGGICLKCFAPHDKDGIYQKPILGNKKGNVREGGNR